MLPIQIIPFEKERLHIKPLLILSLVHPFYHNVFESKAILLGLVDFLKHS